MSGPWINPPSGRNAQTFDSPTFTGTVTGAEKLLAQWAIPFIYTASGSMGNNGALTMGTALPMTPTYGAWILLPAGAIAAGVPAAPAWYWAVFSTNAAATVYNSTYTSGIPSAGVTTAFSTTGPGAFTSLLAETTGPVINVAGNSMGPNGQLIFDASANHASNANPKTYKAKFGATTVWNAAATSSPASALGSIKNRSVTNRQVSRIVPGYTGDSAGVTYPAEDTTATVQFSMSITKGVATDNAIIEGGSLFVCYGA